MKILIVPDVHGSHKWEEVKNKIDTVDKIVFLGDYFDSWENEWPDQGENFKNICDFKRANADKVVLLIGNHDFGYISGTREGGCVSGHQNSKISEIRALITANLDIIDLAYEADGWVFSHAGFSKTWVGYMKHFLHEMLDKYPDDEGRTEFESQEDYEQYWSKVESTALIWDENEWSIPFLNEIWHKVSHFPSDENFYYSFDELIDWHGCFSGSGNEPTQGPTWIRPEALLESAYYPYQVVGHTEYCIDSLVTLRENGNTIVMADSPHHSVFDVFDTENPLEVMTMLEFSRFYKQTSKKINNLKSLFGGLGADYAEDEKIKKIEEEFGKEKAFFFYKNYF